MSATEIILEINRLPPPERDLLRAYARENLEPGQLPSDELGELTRRMVEAKNPAEAERLKQEIIRGFYGDAGPDA